MSVEVKLKDMFMYPRQGMGVAVWSRIPGRGRIKFWIVTWVNVKSWVLSQDQGQDLVIQSGSSQSEDQGQEIHSRSCSNSMSRFQIRVGIFQGGVKILCFKSRSGLVPGLSFGVGSRVKVGVRSQVLCQKSGLRQELGSQVIGQVQIKFGSWVDSNDKVRVRIESLV